MQKIVPMLPGKVFLYRKMALSEARSWGQGKGLLKHKSGANNAAYFSYDLDKVKQFHNKNSTEAEVILRLAMDESLWLKVFNGNQTPQHGSKGSSKVKYNYEGLDPREYWLKNIGVLYDQPEATWLREGMHIDGILSADGKETLTPDSLAPSSH